MQIEVPPRHQLFVNARAIVWRQTHEGIEYVVQRRDKPGRPALLEFPGGTVDVGESLVAAVRREVEEETGLRVVEVEGTAVECQGNDASVEGVTPFAAYQTLEGFNGMGVYFRCRAEGDIQASGDGSSEVRWVSQEELGALLEDHLDDFNAMTGCVLMLMRARGLI